MAASVIVSPEAFCAISLHATRHKYSTVHGVLIGSCVDSILFIEEAVPLCHASPTMPLVDAALGLLADRNIVGWYTAPMLLEDTTPSPVAVKMASNLEASCRSKIGPVLVVVQNLKFAQCSQGTDVAAVGESLKAFGKHGGKPLTSLLASNIKDANRALKALKEALAQNYQLNDFEDHLQGPPSSPFPDMDLTKLVDKIRV